MQAEEGRELCPWQDVEDEITEVEKDEKRAEQRSQPKWECIRCHTHSSVFWNKIEVNAQAGWFCDACMADLYDFIHNGDRGKKE